MDYSPTFWLTVILPLAAVAIAIQVFFLLTMREVLRNVSPQNRAMEPNHVWLNFIPLFNLVWTFVIVVKVRDSARDEFLGRRWASTGDFGFGVGIAYAVLSIISWGFLGIAALVCFVIYWVRMSELKNQLKQSQPPYGWITAPSYGGQWGQNAYGGYPNYASPAPQGPARNCPSCGAAAGSGDVYCRSCGTATQLAPSAENAAGATEAAGVSDEAETSDGGVTTGSGVAQAPSCPFCGAAYRPNAMFCSGCGRPVT